MLNILTTCPRCGHYHEVSIYFEDFMAWQEGAHLQDVAPYLDAHDRELLISGLCRDCWETIFEN